MIIFTMAPTRNQQRVLGFKVDECRSLNTEPSSLIPRPKAYEPFPLRLTYALPGVWCKQS